MLTLRGGSATSLVSCTVRHRSCPPIRPRVCIPGIFRVSRDTRLITVGLLLWGAGERLFLNIRPLCFEQCGAACVQIGGFLSIGAVVSAASFLPAGIMGDRLPREWVMVGGWIRESVGVLLVANARNWQGLVPGLLVHALSAYRIPVIKAYPGHAVDGCNLGRTLPLSLPLALPAL